MSSSCYHSLMKRVTFFCLLVASLLLAVLVGCRDTSPTSTPPGVSPGTVAPPQTFAGGAKVATLGEPARGKEWALQRIEAVAQLYGITPEGLNVLRSVDLRQMRAQPGWFGSFGFKKWTGVGSARPASVMHELGHAYWGAFPVTGFPELSWDISRGDRSAMSRYHADVLKFLRQPPDHYELFRSRLPKKDQDALIHFVEADVVSTVAGGLNLLPPILRKYWDQFLPAGQFISWYDAVDWYQSLSKEDRAFAKGYTGFVHFDLRRFTSLKSGDPSELPLETKEVLRGEERQRLWDFSDQFDLLLGDPKSDGNFHFWRGYFRGLLDIHKGQPGFLPSLGLPRTREIADALDFLKELEEVKQERRAKMVLSELRFRPFLGHFLPAIDYRTLLEVFRSGEGLPEGATITGTATFVELLKSLSPVADKVLKLGRRNAQEGTAELQRVLVEVEYGEETNLDLFFEILQESDDRTARKVVAGLSDATLRRLLTLKDQGFLLGRLWTLLGSDRLLETLDINLDAAPEKLAEGIKVMIEHPAGNPRTEEPFIDALYKVIAMRGDRNPRETLAVISDSPFPMERFILNHPSSTVRILGSDFDLTLKVIEASDPLLLAPPRFLYRLVHADPELTAEIIATLDDQRPRRGDMDGHAPLVIEALAFFAYDADRLAAVPDLPISLEMDGLFLAKLLEDQGETWLQSGIEGAVRQYSQRVEDGEVDQDFLEAYEKTLNAAVDTLADSEQRRALEEIFRAAFSKADAGY